MIMDDSKWFSAGKRIRDEWAPVVEETLRINAIPTISVFEEKVEDDVIAWLNDQPFTGYHYANREEIINAYWKQLLE